MPHPQSPREPRAREPRSAGPLILEPLFGPLPEPLRWNPQRASTFVVLLDTGAASGSAAASAVAIARRWKARKRDLAPRKR